MADFIYNQLHIFNSHKSIIETVIDERKDFNLNNIEKMPHNIVYDLKTQWMNEHWGVTKHVFDTKVYKNIISFKSKWTIPLKAILELSKLFPNSIFILKSRLEFTNKHHCYSICTGEYVWRMDLCLKK